MTIDECIEFAEDINATVTFPEDCDKDRQFFETIVELLEELKALKAINKTENNLKEMTMFFNGYNKAIDEYRKEMQDMIEGNEEFTDWQKYEILECNDLVAEQLKAGVNNE